MFAEGGPMKSSMPKKGDLETVACPQCGAAIERPIGTESVCGPHGHKVPATVVAPVLLFGFPVEEDPTLETPEIKLSPIVLKLPE